MPPEASLAAAEASVKFKYIDSPELEDPCWLPDDTPLINSEEQPIAKTALDQMDIIAVCLVYAFLIFCSIIISHCSSTFLLNGVLLVINSCLSC